MIGSEPTRIINYNWRGQGMSSVFTDGTAGDISLGNTSTEVDWPALTQAETYFAKSPDATQSNNAKRWLGMFVANGQGTTGMLYRRNRYFDPKSGQFTQADPIGIAGGMNAFGFADGDPVNFSDPFGLCRGPSDLRCVGETKPGVLGTLLAAVGDVSKKWWAVHKADVIQFGMALITEGMSLESEGIAFRPDVKLIGGRSGGKITTLEGPASSYVRGGGSRVFETNALGKIVRDISPERVKILETNRGPSGQIFERWRKVGPPTDADAEILRRMGVSK